MAFRTKLDFSNNRQVKQHIETSTVLSGATNFGVPFSELPTGPNLSTSGETNYYNFITSTFSGNSAVTVYNWYDSSMALGEASLSAITPSNSAITQTVNPIFTPNTLTTIDGNTVALDYSGVSYDILAINMTDLGGGNYSGTVETNELFIYSAGTLDFTGRTIWTDVSGITRTDRLIVGNNPTVGYVLTCINSEGMVAFLPSSGGSSGLTSNIWVAGTGIGSAVLSGSGGVASGDYSIAEGLSNTATGFTAHAEGGMTTASGDYSHAEGKGTVASNAGTHAEGDNTVASGLASHSQNSQTIASGDYSHAEGLTTTASGTGSHAEGASTISSSDASHAEGAHTIASGSTSHAEGNYTIAGGGSSHAEGGYTIATGGSSHAEGYQTQALSDTSHAEGYLTIAAGMFSHAEGQSTYAGVNSHAEGNATYATATSHAEGYQTSAMTQFCHAEGWATIAIGNNSHAEGYATIASGDTSHAEGSGSIASGGRAAHAEGYLTIASGDTSHAQGAGSIAGGTTAHAEGSNTQALGDSSHAEGYGTITTAFATHAGGYQSTASGQYSFVHGSGSTASGLNTIVLGSGISGASADTTYVDYLNVKRVLSTAFSNDIRIDANGNLTTNTSDERLKENIKPLTGALEKVKALQGVTYQWKDRYAGGNDVKLGFIAQQVETVEPLLVFTNKDENQYKGLHIDGIIPLLVEAIKELTTGETLINNQFLETQTILAEDNNIDLNYNGTQESAVDGGMRVLHAKGLDLSAELVTDLDGNWVTNNDFKPNALTIPEYTPTSSNDENGKIGNISRDEDYIYIKTTTGWKRSNLENF